MIDPKAAEPLRRVVILCAACLVPLTRPLVLFAEALVEADGEPAIPPGFTRLSPGVPYPEGEWVANLGDLLNTDRHPDARRLNGCRGLDGCDGLNRVCVNGHEVGTERSDCWWAHGIHFAPERVRLTDA